MQLSIFISHIVGTVATWGIHAAWGLSDSSEQFVLLSGLTLGSVFTLKLARDGFTAAHADMLGRTGRLYGRHLLMLTLFLALVVVAQSALPLPDEIIRLGWCYLLQEPWLAVPAAAAMLYQPAFMGILPVFIVCMLLLPGFCWLAERWGGWALVPSFALYLSVQMGWVATPAEFPNGIAFDPLAWQFLFLLGAHVGRRALLHGAGMPRSPALLAASLAVIAFGFWARLIEHGMLDGPAWAAALLQGKEALSPARLLHALALAYAVAALVPRAAAWMFTPAADALAAVGRNSLPVFCVGIFLGWAATTALRLLPAPTIWADLGLVGAGILALVAYAAWLNGRRAPAKRPAPA